jgi:pyruvyl transferase EpsO
VVITDRLHAHILSLLLGIPNIILDNSYGKVRDFHETWTSGSDIVTMATSPEHARSLAAECSS